MLLKLIFLFVFPITWGYKINVSGKIEMGEELAALLDVVRDRLFQDGNLENVLAKVTGNKVKLTSNNFSMQKKNAEYNSGPYEQKHGYQTSNQKVLTSHDYENAEKKTTQHQSPELKADLALLDELVRKGEQKAHVFGKHSVINKWPVNNINV
ncbi:hypothetical protein evm_013043 [Chilo suppressalis]|nr:hypothetical protein evm_013043 [Chilo suppressalis]